MGVVGSNYRIFSPEIWSAFLKIYFKNKLYAAKFFLDFSSDLKGGGDMITIPNLTEGPAPINLTTTTGALTDFVVSETRTQLTLDTWKGASKVFSDFEAARIASHYNLQEMELRDNIAYKLAQVLDTGLIGQTGGSLSINLHTGTSAVQVNNTAIQEAIRIAASYSLDRSGLAFFFHPNAFWGELMRRHQIVDASQFGKPTLGAGGGAMGGEFNPVAYLYGIPLYETPQVGTCSGIGGDGYPSTSHRNLLIHKRAIVYALANIDGMGVGPRLQTTSMLPGGNLAMRVVGDIAYGIKLIGANEAVRIISDT